MPTNIATPTTATTSTTTTTWTLFMVCLYYIVTTFMLIDFRCYALELGKFFWGAVLNSVMPEIPKLWSAPPRGVLLDPGGAVGPEGDELFLWGTYLFWTKYGCKIIFLVGIWLVEIFYLSQVLAPNYKKHILSPAKVGKLCYSLAERYVESVYFNLFGWGVKFMNHFKAGRKL
jgi:hypothetical protein